VLILVLDLVLVFGGCSQWEKSQSPQLEREIEKWWCELVAELLAVWLQICVRADLVSMRKDV